MTRLEKCILSCMRYTPRTLKAAKLRVRLLHPCLHVSDYAFQVAVDSLEDKGFIEELGKQELLARKSGEDYSGIVDDFSGKYIATDEFGVECADEIAAENYRFYLPIVISFLSLCVSVCSLICAR